MQIVVRITSGTNFRESGKRFLFQLTIGSGINSDEVFESCVKCTRQSMIFYNKLNIWVCFSCGNGWNNGDLIKCIRCGMYDEDFSDSLCTTCRCELGDSISIPELQVSNQLQI